VDEKYSMLLSRLHEDAIGILFALPARAGGQNLLRELRAWPRISNALGGAAHRGVRNPGELVLEANALTGPAV